MLSECICLVAGRHTLKICCYRSRLVVNCCFDDTDISQVSVATQLRCGGIFIDSVVVNVSPIQTVNKIESRPIFDEVKAYNTKCASFLGHHVYFRQKSKNRKRHLLQGRKYYIITYNFYYIVSHTYYSMKQFIMTH